MTSIRSTAFAVFGLLAGRFVMAASAEAAFYERNALAYCADDTYCEVVFPVVPAGKLLIIKHVTCSITNFAAGELSRVALFVKTGTADYARRQALFAASQSNNVGGKDVHVVAQDTNTRIGPGKRAAIGANFSPLTVSDVDCQVTGDIL